MTYRFLPALALALLLASCGGGGEEDSAAPDAPSTATNAGLQLTVPTPTYAAMSEELQAFNTLNSARHNCGYGKLAQNTALDTSARGHAQWLTYHAVAQHEQTPGTLFFTGASPLARMIASGYLSNTTEASVSEQLAYYSGSGGNDTIGSGVRGTHLLLNAPYHANGMLAGFREVGVAVRNAIDAGAPDANDPGAGRQALVFNTGYKAAAGSQADAQPDSSVFTYPCDGEIDVTRALYHESPNPVVGRDLSTNPLGTSIMVSIQAGRTLTIDSASLSNIGTGSYATLRTPVTSSNDPHGAFEAHQAYVAADAPLLPATTYRATINGRNNGVAFVRTFLFTTEVN